jgi:hypothetical protein
MSVEERLKILREAKPGSWIVFSADENRVIGSGATFSEAMECAKRCRDEDDPIFTFIPPNWAPMLL